MVMNVSMSIDKVIWSLIKEEGPRYIDTEDLKVLTTRIHDLLVVDSITMCNALIEKRLEQIRLFRNTLQELLAQPQVEQRTPEWHDMRKNRLTASDTATAMNRGKFETRKNLLRKKAFPHLFPFQSNYIMKWGTMFETVANRCYRQRNGDMVIHEFGLVPHPTIPHYGASPDGITELGIMLELKCPMKRRIDGTIPEQYEIQMQGQMAVCGLSECDYVECGLEDFQDVEAYLAGINATSMTDHGIVLEYSDQGVMSYDYSPEYLTPAEAWIWAQERIKTEQKHLVKITPWKLREYFTERVNFDPERWVGIEKDVATFWQDVEQTRAMGEQALEERPPTRRRERATKVIEFIDDESGDDDSKK